MVQIPPSKFGQPKDQSAYEILSKEYQGIIDTDLGFVISITEIVEIGPGEIIHGSAGTFHPVKFSILTYRPQQFEVVEGEVVELVDFGAFIRLGPNDGLCHRSQAMNEVVDFEEINERFKGKESQRILERGDLVRVRIIAVGRQSGRAGKIGLTMRQPFLGKIEWIADELEEKNKEALDKGRGKKKKKTSKKKKKSSKKK